MSTKNFVPRANNEGGIGTEAKQWGSVWSKNIYVDGTNVKNTLTTLEQNLGTLNTAAATKATTFNSVALMKEAPLEPGMVAMTTGYHNPNDGGAGVYTIRTKKQSDVEDGGSIIFLDNGNVAECIDLNIPRTFDTVADLKNASLFVGLKVSTKGYYSVNDGGSALYTIRTKDVADVDDGGSIIFLNNGNVAELITDGTVNVKQFGAKGDGVTDDTNAFRNVLAYAVGKNLVVSEGIYAIDSILFADGVKAVNDNGIYTNVKPCYPNTVPQFDGIETMSRYSKMKVFVPSGYVGVQGVCYDSKRNKFIIAIFNSSNQCVLSVWSKDLVLEDYSHVLPQLGHCNDIAYVPETDCFYVTGVDDNGSTSYQYIDVVDASTFTIVKRISVAPRYCVQFGFDNVNKLFVAVHKDTDIGNESVLKLHFYDIDFNYIKTNEFRVPQYYTTNGMDCHNGRLSVICFTNRWGRNYDHAILDTDYYGNNIQFDSFPLSSEPEGMCRIDDGRLLLFSSLTYVYNGTYYNTGFDVFQFKNGIEPVIPLSSFQSRIYGDQYYSAGVDLDTIIEPVQDFITGIKREGGTDVLPTDAELESWHYPKWVGATDRYQVGGYLSVKKMGTESNKASVVIEEFVGNHDSTRTNGIWYRKLRDCQNAPWRRLDSAGALPNNQGWSVAIEGVNPSGTITFVAPEDGYISTYGEKSSYTGNAWCSVVGGGLSDRRTCPANTDMYFGSSLVVRKGTSYSINFGGNIAKASARFTFMG